MLVPAGVREERVSRRGSNPCLLEVLSEAAHVRRINRFQVAPGSWDEVLGEEWECDHLFEGRELGTWYSGTRSLR